MKTYIYLSVWIVFLCFGAGFTTAQSIVTSNGTGGGGWDVPSTWQGGSVPDNADSVVILGTDSVYIHPVPSVPETCLSLTVLSGGKVAASSPADTFVVLNVLTLRANAWYFDSSYSGTLPGKTRVIDHASTVVFGTSTIGGPGNLEFGNVVMRRGAGATAGGDLLIHGNLTINNLSNGNTLKGIDKNVKGWRNHVIEGNVYFYKGAWSCVDVGSDSTNGCIWNVNGDVIVTCAVAGDARLGPFSSAFATDTGIFNFKGNLSMNGGRLQAGSSSSLATGKGIINLWGNFTFTGGSWVTTNTKGPFSFNFVGSGLQTIKMDSSFTMKTKVYDTVATGSSVIFDLGNRYWNSTDTAGGTGGGEFLVNGILAMKDSSYLKGTAAFTLNPGATLKIGKNDGITQMPDSTNGNIRVTGTRTYSPLANYEYNSSVKQSTGDGLPSSLINLTINNPNGVDLNSSTTVNGTLSLLDGSLTTVNDTVTLGPSGILIEPSGKTVIGRIMTTRTVGASLTENFGGIGTAITSSATAPGSTTVFRRTGLAESGNGYSSILRYFEIAPAMNTGLNAGLDFYYDAGELAGQNGATLQLWKSEDNGSTWAPQPGTADAGHTKVHAGGIDSFSRWTAADVMHPLGVSMQLFSLNLGWNMMSLPYKVPDPRKTVLFPSATSLAFTYTDHYVKMDTIIPGPGFWLKFGAKEDRLIFGSDILIDTIDLNVGWNMIGSIAVPVPKNAIEQIPPGIVTSEYFGYAGSYANADTIQPRKGYWVKVGSIGKLVLKPATAVDAKSGKSLRELLKEFSALTITDKSGNSATLYVGAEGGAIAASMCELPPAPPEGLFNVRFASQRFAETYAPGIGKAEIYPIMISSAEYPITVSWHVIDARISVTLSDAAIGKSSFQQTMAGDGSLKLDKPAGSLVLTISDPTSLPAEFSLSQNYPNPFNPSTKFVVALPKASHVEVIVYDLLGQKVRTLLQDYKSAGFHTVEWNGLTGDNTQATSGVYLVRMTSESFSAVRKVIMMK